MKKLKIKAPEGYEIDKDNSTFEEIVFKEIEKEYPQSVEEIEGRDWYIASTAEINCSEYSSDVNQISTEERAEAFLALMQLRELHAKWNEIDGGNKTPTETKSIFNTDCEDVYFDFYFHSRETRDLFEETFADLIEKVKGI